MIRGRTAQVADTSELDQILGAIRASETLPGMAAASTAAARIVDALPADIDDMDARAIGTALVIVAWGWSQALNVATAGAAFTPTGQPDPRMIAETAGNILGLVGASLTERGGR